MAKTWVERGRRGDGADGDGDGDGDGNGDDSAGGDLRAWPAGRRGRTGSVKDAKGSGVQGKKKKVGGGVCSSQAPQAATTEWFQ
eukprot:1075525-Pleurochrysis_carterae.AAC.1